jgi:hypothetical protein
MRCYAYVNSHWYHGRELGHGVTSAWSVVVPSVGGGVVTGKCAAKSNLYPSVELLS